MGNKQDAVATHSIDNLLRYYSFMTTNTCDGRQGRGDGSTITGNGQLLNEYIQLRWMPGINCLPSIRAPLYMSYKLRPPAAVPPTGMSQMSDAQL